MDYSLSNSSNKNFAPKKKHSDDGCHRCALLIFVEVLFSKPTEKPVKRYLAVCFVNRPRERN